MFSIFSGTRSSEMFKTEKKELSQDDQKDLYNVINNADDRYEDMLDKVQNTFLTMGDGTQKARDFIESVFETTLAFQSSVGDVFSSLCVQYLDDDNFSNRFVEKLKAWAKEVQPKVEQQSTPSGQQEINKSINNNNYNAQNSHSYNAPNSNNYNADLNNNNKLNNNNNSNSNNLNIASMSRSHNAVDEIIKREYPQEFVKAVEQIEGLKIYPNGNFCFDTNAENIAVKTFALKETLKSFNMYYTDRFGFFYDQELVNSLDFSDKFKIVFDSWLNSGIEKINHEYRLPTIAIKKPELQNIKATVIETKEMQQKKEQQKEMAKERGELEIKSKFAGLDDKQLTVSQLLNKLQYAFINCDFSQNEISNIDVAITNILEDITKDHADFLAGIDRIFRDNGFLSPLNFELIKDPYYIKGGSMITAWFEKGELESLISNNINRDPMTRRVFGKSDITFDADRKAVLMKVRKELIKLIIAEYEKNKPDFNALIKNFENNVNFIIKNPSIEVSFKNEMQIKQQTNEIRQAAIKVEPVAVKQEPTALTMEAMLVDLEFMKFLEACKGEAKNEPLEATVLLLDPDKLVAFAPSTMNEMTIDKAKEINFIHTAIRVGNYIIHQEADGKIVTRHKDNLKLLTNDIVEVSLGNVNETNLKNFFVSILTDNASKEFGNNCEHVTGVGVKLLKNQSSEYDKLHCGVYLNKVFAGQYSDKIYDNQKLKFRTHKDVDTYSSAKRGDLEKNLFLHRVLKAIDRRYYLLNMLEDKPQYKAFECIFGDPVATKSIPVIQPK